MSVHRSYRALADKLCQSGHVVIRFDFYNTGDSSGDNVEQLTLESCVEDLVGLVDYARDSYSPGQLSCIGFSFGALVCYEASQQVCINNLVLWEPTLSGKRYLRQLRMLGMSGKEVLVDESVVESAGVFLTPEFSQQLENHKFSSVPPVNINRCLILNSSITPAIEKLGENWLSESVSMTVEEYQGYSDMIAYPIDTVVSESALEKIGHWLEEGSEESTEFLQCLRHNNQIGELKNEPLAPLAMNGYRESPCIVSDKKLFGVVTLPDSKKSNLCVVFLNCGSEHHVGPHRMYTEFCRSLAREGITGFRFDIEGIGDSPSCGNNQDNVSYSPCVLDDVSVALEYLRERLGDPEFVLVGICAGAYHSFKAAAKLSDFNIKYACMVNPLVFYWENDMAERERKRIGLGRERAKYRDLIFQLQTWKNLISRPVAAWNMFKVYLNHFLYQLGSLYYGRSASQREVRQSILNIQEANIQLAFFISQNDPGLNLFLDEGGRIARKTFKAGLSTIVRLPNSDHGLSKRYMRQYLYENVIDIIQGSK